MTYLSNKLFFLTRKRLFDTTFVSSITSNSKISIYELYRHQRANLQRIKTRITYRLRKKKFENTRKKLRERRKILIKSKARFDDSLKIKILTKTKTKTKTKLWAILILKIITLITTRLTIQYNWLSLFNRFDDKNDERNNIIINNMWAQNIDLIIA